MYYTIINSTEKCSEINVQSICTICSELECSENSTEEM